MAVFNRLAAPSWGGAAGAGCSITSRLGGPVRDSYGSAKVAVGVQDERHVGDLVWLSVGCGVVGSHPVVFEVRPHRQGSPFDTDQ